MQTSGLKKVVLALDPIACKLLMYDHSVSCFPVPSAGKAASSGLAHFIKMRLSFGEKRKVMRQPQLEALSFTNNLRDENIGKQIT